MLLPLTKKAGRDVTWPICKNIAMKTLNQTLIQIILSLASLILV